MNFVEMPELQWEFGYHYFKGVMLCVFLTSVSSILLFTSGCLSWCTCCRGASSCCARRRPSKIHRPSHSEDHEQNSTCCCCCCCFGGSGNGKE
mmetsp:Transcript_77848/g.196542  ORF Transcript_77848/g.196542 Transcript_77848/m.196542 type:complete len:93 (+) Transcript_77848:2-280(+)